MEWNGIIYNTKPKFWTLQTFHKENAETHKQETTSETVNWSKIEKKNKSLIVEPHIFRLSYLYLTRGRRIITGRMTAGRGLTSPEEEEEDSDVAEEKVGLSLSDG